MFQHLYALLDPDDWRFLAAAWLPAILAVVALKIVRVATLSEPPPAGAYPTLFRSDLFFVLAALAGSIAILRVGRRLGRLHLPARLALTLSAGLVVVANGFAHLFYRATGSVLTGSLLRHGWKRRDELYGMIDAGTSVGLLVATVAAAALLQIAPWLAARTAGPPDEADPPAWRPTIYTAATSLFCLLTAWLPAADLETGAGFAREPTLHLASTLLAGASPADQTTRFRMQPPTSAELIPAERRTDDGTDDEAGGDRKNLVFVVLESTRARSTSIHDPDLATTPFLAELSESSLTMREAYTVLPHTSKALVSIACGIPPMPRMAILEARPGAIPARCLPELLGDRGYRTGFFQTATDRFEDRDVLVENFGVDDFYSLEDLDREDHQKVNYFGIEEHALLAPSRQWLEARGDAPFFATYLTLSPHHDYRFSDRYGAEQFADDPKLDRYLNAVHYVDHFLAELFEQYRDLGLYEETVFFVFADHGEAFGEHGRFQHDNVIYQEGARVPWIIHAPGEESLEAGTVERPVNLLDIVPTAIELLDFEVEGADYPGRDVRDAPADRVQFFSCFYDDKCLGALFRGYKYIHHYDKRPDELFDLDDDPRERTDVAERHPKLVAGLRGAVRDWRVAVENLYREYWRHNPPRESRKREIEHERDLEVGRGIAFRGFDTGGGDDTGDETGDEPPESLQAIFRLERAPDSPTALRLVATSHGRRHVLGGRAMGGIHTLEGVEPGDSFHVELEPRLPADWPEGPFDVEVELLTLDRRDAPTASPPDAGDADESSIERRVEPVEQVRLFRWPPAADDPGDSEID